MSLKPGAYGHAPGYRAAAGELLACAAAQASEWTAYSPGSTCLDGYRFLSETRHWYRAMDADGCNILTRDDRARLAVAEGAGQAESTAVVEFCLVCGTVEWLDEGFRREAENPGQGGGAGGLPAAL